MGNCVCSQEDPDPFLITDDSLQEESQHGEPQVNTPQFVPISNQNPGPIYHLHPGNPCYLYYMSDEDQIKIAKRMGLLNHIPTGYYTESTTSKIKECIICMCDYTEGEELRYLPCLHTFHRSCIDDWLMRSFTCPSCLEPVEPALLLTYQPN